MDVFSGLYSKNCSRVTESYPDIQPVRSMPYSSVNWIREHHLKTLIKSRKLIKSNLFVQIFYHDYIIRNYRYSHNINDAHMSLKFFLYIKVWRPEGFFTMVSICIRTKSDYSSLLFIYTKLIGFESSASVSD
jgi:hypothetical protein